MDTTRNPSEAAIEFFKRIKKVYPKTETGAIDPSKVDYHMLEASDDPEIMSYLFKKLPEFLLRGWDVMAPYYAICSPKTEKSDKSYDEIALAKISQGDLSDVKKFEEFYPSLQLLAMTLRGKMGRAGYWLDRMIWRNEDIIPDDMKEDYEKYRDVYEQIVQSEGMYRYNGVLHESNGIEMLLQSETDNRDEIRFALKVVKLYELRRSDSIFNSKRLQCMEENNEAEKKRLEERKQKAKEAEEDFEKADAKVKKYNIITSFFKRKQKKKDIETRDKLEKNVKYLNGTIREIDEHIEQTDREIEFIKKYEAKYREGVVKYLVPKLKEIFGKKLTKEQATKVGELIDVCFSKESVEATNGDPLSFMSGQLDEIGEEPFEEYFARFNNALMTMGGIADAFLKFEEQENKTLYRTLRIIRGELHGVPTDKDHSNEITEDFREFDLDTDSGMNDFMSATPHPEQIAPLMRELSDVFDSTMREENLEEYIKNVGKIWYRLLLIHPFVDGNGRTGRYLLNILLADKGIIIPALFNSKNEQDIFQEKLDQFVIYKLNKDYDKVGEEFLEIIREIGIDITGEDRLKKRPSVELTLPEEVPADEEPVSVIRK